MAQKRKNNNGKKNHNNKNQKNNFDAKAMAQKAAEIHEITFTDGITVSELAEKICRQPSDIIKTLFMEGKMVTMNSALDDETVELVCISYDIEATKVKEREEDSLEIDEVDDPDMLRGKTSNRYDYGSRWPW